MTAQVKEVLIYNNEEVKITGLPLANYLKEIKLPHKLVSPNTACKKGYYSKWAIDNKKLFLIEWQGYILDYQEVGIEYLFPDEEFVFAEWFTGEIRIGLGNIICYTHSGFVSVYEGELFLKFENGVLVDEFKKWLTQQEIENIKKEVEEEEKDTFF